MVAGPLLKFLVRGGREDPPGPGQAGAGSAATRRRRSKTGSSLVWLVASSMVGWVFRGESLLAGPDPSPGGATAT